MRARQQRRAGVRYFSQLFREVDRALKLFVAKCWLNSSSIARRRWLAAPCSPLPFNAAVNSSVENETLLRLTQAYVKVGSAWTACEQVVRYGAVAAVERLGGTNWTCVSMEVVIGMSCTAAEAVSGAASG
jgi:hypothetical protein